MGRSENKKLKPTFLEEQVKKLVTEKDNSSSEDELTIEEIRQQIQNLEKIMKLKEVGPSSSSAIKVKKRKIPTDDVKGNRYRAPRDGKDVLSSSSQMAKKAKLHHKEKVDSSLIREAQEVAQLCDEEVLPINNNLQITEPSGEGSGLYGKNHEEETMIDIGNNIFCRQPILNMALTSSCKPTHVARKLIEGVFTLPTILKSTLKGVAPRAQSKERQKEKVMALDFNARNSIIDFAIQKGLERTWDHQEIKTIETSMSQRLGEIKRLEKRKLESIVSGFN